MFFHRKSSKIIQCLAQPSNMDIKTLPVVLRQTPHYNFVKRASAINSMDFTMSSPGKKFLTQMNFSSVILKFFQFFKKIFIFQLKFSNYFLKTFSIHLPDPDTSHFPTRQNDNTRNVVPNRLRDLYFHHQVWLFAALHIDKISCTSGMFAWSWVLPPLKQSASYKISIPTRF